MKKYGKNFLYIFNLFRGYNKENKDTKKINCSNNEYFSIINKIIQTKITFKNKTQKLNQKNISKNEFSIFINSIGGMYKNKNNNNEISKIYYKFKYNKDNTTN